MPCLPINRVIQQNCARSYEWPIAALETGVECGADQVRLQEPPREMGDIGISHSAYELKKQHRVWTSIRMGSGLVVDYQTDLSRGADDGVIATDVRRRGENITSIVIV